MLVSSPSSPKPAKWDFTLTYLGGDSDYFDRPESSTIKAALVLYNDNIHIKILDNDTDFGDSMDTNTLNDICGSTLTQTKTVSLFNLVNAAGDSSS